MGINIFADQPNNTTYNGMQWNIYQEGISECRWINSWSECCEPFLKRAFLWHWKHGLSQGRVLKDEIHLWLLKNNLDILNIARVRNCPDVTILTLFFVFVFFHLSFCFFFLIFCLFAFSSRHHSDHMPEGSQVSKVSFPFKRESVTKGRYRAVRQGG